MTHAAAGTKPLFGQPRGLTVLFLTQMWETFSYYGMRALLVYYMTRQLLFTQQSASLVYGVYTAMVYFTPIFGGIVSDRWLGRRRAVLIGGTTMAAGHFLLAFEPLFFLALACIALGNGLFLPSLPSQIDALYPQGDLRRFSAYNVYYLGINLGGVMAPLVCGWLGETYGWHVGFAAAGVGMMLGLLIYVMSAKYLPDTGRVHVQASSVVSADGDGLRTRLLALLLVGLCVVLFRGAYEQIGNTIALWADTGIDRRFGSRQIPMTWFAALNPLFVILFTPMLLAWWATREKRGRALSPMRKMARGAGGVALAYALLAGVSATHAGGHAGWGWLVAFLLLFTLSELFILPVGLGLFARLGPAGHRATTVAAWYFAAFGGNLLAGVIGMGWTALGAATFFVLAATIAAISGVLMRSLDTHVNRIDAMTRR